MKLTTFILLFALASVSFAQQHAVLKGQVTHEESGEAIPFATVVLKYPDGEIISGAYSDFDGHFYLQPISPGIYTLEVSHLEYHKKVLEDLQFAPGRVYYQELKMKDYTYDPRPQPNRYYHDEITRSALSFSSLLMFVLAVLVL